MGAHSAGRRVVAPGRWTKINRTLEGLAVAGIIGAVAYFTFTSTSSTPAADAGGGAGPTAQLVIEPTDSPVPPIPGYEPITSEATPTVTPRPHRTKMGHS